MPHLDRAVPDDALAREPGLTDGPVVVAGLGNIHRVDDGAGVEVVRRLGVEPRIPGVRLVVAGTCTRRVITEFPDARAMILVAAAADAAPAGSVHYAPVDGAEGATLTRLRWGMNELLESAIRTGAVPPLHIYTISIGQALNRSTTLSFAVAAGVAIATCMVHGHALRLANGSRTGS